MSIFKNITLLSKIGNLKANISKTDKLNEKLSLDNRDKFVIIYNDINYFWI